MSLGRPFHGGRSRSNVAWFNKHFRGAIPMSLSGEFSDIPAVDLAARYGALRLAFGDKKRRSATNRS